eukprot:6318509-Amphidinium_carterae.1
MATTTVAKPRTDLKRPATAHTEDVVSTSTSSHARLHEMLFCVFGPTVKLGTDTMSMKFWWGG